MTHPILVTGAAGRGFRARGRRGHDDLSISDDRRPALYGVADAILVHPTMAEGLATLFRALPARP